jgi:hypothetical protein
MGVGDCDVVISLFLWVMLLSLLSYVLGCLGIVSMFSVAFILDLDVPRFGIFRFEHDFGSVVLGYSVVGTYAGAVHIYTY